ncbi:putative disease resistance protein RGA1 [Elaeis guineensis]|uniref:putative disease resistance protein RGA1 n=1 Tax=Elaeis guineensis var. tenera TaxID=51953 RepID=UPI003C6D4DCA
MDMGKIVMTVGGWFASYVGNKLADKVSQHLEDQSMADMVEYVKARLPCIQAPIQAAERWPIEDQVLAAWLRKLKDAAYEADDVLDELEFNELHDKLFKKRKMSDFASSAVELLQRFIMPDDDLENLKKLVRNFDEIYLDINSKEEQLKDYNAKQKSVSRETSSLIQDRPVGREKDMILDLLLHLADDRNPQSNVGLGLVAIRVLVFFLW